MSKASQLEIRLLGLESGDLLNAEAVVLIDDRDALATVSLGTDQCWKGLHPSDHMGLDRAFSFPAAIPDGGPASADDHFVAVCGCGFLECGGLVASIRDLGNEIVWDRFRQGATTKGPWTAIGSEPLRFERQQYLHALAHPTNDGEWQPVTRLAARRAIEPLFEAHLEQLHLRVAECSPQGDESVLVVVMFGRPGDDDRTKISITLHRQQGESPDELAARLVDIVASGAILDHPDAVHSPLPPHPRRRPGTARA